MAGPNLLADKFLSFFFFLGGGRDGCKENIFKKYMSPPTNMKHRV